MSAPAVTLDNISKSYRLGFTRKLKSAVEALSLDVESGSVFGLLGPNGAGKTTTLKIILGLVFPDSGNGHVLGKPIGHVSSRRMIGFLPEQPYFYGFLTAEKGLDLYSRFFGLSPKKNASRNFELLDLVGLPHSSHLTLNKYSKGMLQRFGIAQALINDPQLLILDEPSSGLDPVGQKEIRDVLLGLKNEGKTIFLSSHQLSEVENICDSVSIISKGRKVKEGRLTDLLEVKGLTRITLKGKNDQARERLSHIAHDITEEDGSFILDVESVSTYGALDIARSLGLELARVEPYRRSLEDLFMEAVRESPD